VIKYYAWEQNFTDAINDVRAKEVDVLTSQAYWRYRQRISPCIRAYATLTVAAAVYASCGRRRPSSWINFFLISSPVFVSMATFAYYAVENGSMAPEIVFPALAYFNLLRFPLTFMPVLVIGAATPWARVALTRA